MKHFWRQKRLKNCDVKSVPSNVVGDVILIAIYALENTKLKQK
jgi:hypothetical protein